MLKNPERIVRYAADRTGSTGPTGEKTEILAATPPMGWNSWDVYGPTVREEEVKANADYMAEHLAAFGWQYVIVDIQWYAPKVKSHGYIPDPNNVCLDEYGRVIPDPVRFPSAANGAGFKALADYVHSKGLKFGFHIMRGIPRKAVELNLPIKGTPYHAADVADKEHSCVWQNMTDMYGVDMSKPGGQAYYDSIAELYASWGADFIKADDMSQNADLRYPYAGEEIEGLSQALHKSGRPIILSLSPGPAPVEKAAHLSANAQMWRISGDFWDHWDKLKYQFTLTHQWEKFIQPGNWPDADMLPLGRIGIRAEVGNERHTNFTPDEQVTMMTLWQIFRSPLFFGGDLPSNDPFTLSLLTNPETLSVLKHSCNNHQSYEKDDVIAWTANLPDAADQYVAVFNISDAEKAISLSWKDVDISAGQAALRDLWKREDLGVHTDLRLTLRPHACVFYKVSPK
jgi:hypothetical protein